MLPLLNREHRRAVQTRLKLDILPQPDDTTCGPTCLHAVYRYLGDPIGLEEVISQVRMLHGGGTFAVFLGCHALRRGYQATMYTYNLNLFDPTWFTMDSDKIRERLHAQLEFKNSPRLEAATEGYLEFLALGGKVLLQDLTGSLIRKYLNRSIPILTGLSGTYLYRTPREYGPKYDYDDIRGTAAGHFVVLSGYEKKRRQVFVADPLHPNPMSQSRQYRVDVDRVACAILLGVMTYDANLLIVHPPPRRRMKRK